VDTTSVKPDHRLKRGIITHLQSTLPLRPIHIPHARRRASWHGMLRRKRRRNQTRAAL